MRRLFTLVFIAAMSGCSLLPYDTKIPCEGDEDFGMCSSVSEAHDAAVSGQRSGKRIRRQDDDEDDEFSWAKDDKRGGAQTQYQRTLYKKMAKMLTREQTPLMRPPVEASIRIFAYRGEGPGRPLYHTRDVYVVVDDYEWIIENEALEKSRRGKSLNGMTAFNNPE